MNKKQTIREWFEANYLDGDKIQDGQMLSSAECLNALLRLSLEKREEMLGKIQEEIEKMKPTYMGDPAMTLGITEQAELKCLSLFQMKLSSLK